MLLPLFTNHHSTLLLEIASGLGELVCCRMTSGLSAVDATGTSNQGDIATNRDMIEAGRVGTSI